MMIPIQVLNRIVSNRLSLSCFDGRFVRGLLFGSPPTPPTKSGATPYGKTALNATPLCHYGHVMPLSSVPSPLGRGLG